MHSPTQQLEDVPRRTARVEFRHYVLFQVLLTLAFVVLVFGGVELVARIRQYHRFGPKSLHPMALRDQFTAYRLNPAYGRVDRQHDAQGFRRDMDVSLEKPPNTVRVFITGGSAAYGYPTNMPEDTDNRWRFLYNNQTIDYYLEQQLNQAFPSKHWEVINAGAPAYQLNQELAQIESVLLRYRPDCVILLDGYNDIDTLWKRAIENYDPYASVEDSKEFDLLANPGSFRSLEFFLAEWMRSNSAAFRLMEDHLRSIETLRHSAEQKTLQVSNPVRFSDLTPMEQARFATAHSQLRYYTHSVRQIRRILDLDGVRAIFLLQPVVFVTHKKLTDSEQRILEDELTLRGRSYSFEQLLPEIDASMTATARQEGFVFLNLTDVFDQTSEQTFSDDVHLTPDGNRIIAERLFLLMKDMFAKVKTP
jgi:GDSL-like lipase/acylhydrolase family protein